MDLSQLFQKDASKIHAGSKVNNAKPFLCKRDVISLIGKSAKDVHSDYSLDALLFALRLSMGEGQTLFRYPDMGHASRSREVRSRMPDHATSG